MRGGNEGENLVNVTASASNLEGTGELYKTKPISGSPVNVSIDETGGCDCNDD
jgi:hypothetical protein